jgi:hypothetical protein
MELKSISKNQEVYKHPIVADVPGHEGHNSGLHW